MNAELSLFCKQMPKVELHAHLNGSLSNSTLEKLHCLQKPDEGGSVPWHHWETIINHGEKRSLEECFELFKIAHSLTTSVDAIKMATRSVIEEFSDDGVVYLELRSTPREVSDVMTKPQYIKAIVQAIREESGSSNKIIVKYLASIDRRCGRKAAEETVDAVLEARRSNPDVILGLDLSGDPTKGDIMDYLPLLDKAKEQGLKIAVHCAEVPNFEESKKILQFRPDRIGHGTCLHPDTGGSEDMWNLLLESQIPVEVCLTSNVKSRTVKNYKSHHFDYLHNAKHPISIATDDKGIFATSLSKEYMLAAEAFNLSKDQLWQLSYDSIYYAFATEDEKRQLKQSFIKWKSEQFLRDETSCKA